MYARQCDATHHVSIESGLQSIHPDDAPVHRYSVLCVSSKGPRDLHHSTGSYLGIPSGYAVECLSPW